MLDLLAIDARIEPGAIIRDKVIIGKNAVIMMGAVINIGAEIGEGSMVDMNAVIGARGKIGKRVHLGAGAVVAGVLEPPSKSPCEIGDDVMIGANSVILEGVKIGNGSVVAAGSVVVDDVPAGVVVAGSPAKIVKSVDDRTKNKTQILSDLENNKKPHIGAFYYLNYNFSYIAPFSVTCVFSCPSLFKLSSFSSVTLSILEIDTSYAIFLTTSVSLIFF